MSGFDLILFDCDGVLVDSEYLSSEIDSALLTASGYPISPEEMSERFAGMTWKDALLTIEKEADIPLSASLLTRSDDLLDQKLAKDLQIIDGVKAALAKITEPRCICSNSTTPRLQMMLKKVGLLPYFEPHIFSARDLGEDRVKPKPDIYLHGAKQMGAKPNRCLVIEDSVHGVHAARAAGMRVIGFTGGTHTFPSHADRLTDAGAETVIAHMRDLPATVAALAAWDGIA